MHSLCDNNQPAHKENVGFGSVCGKLRTRLDGEYIYK